MTTFVLVHGSWGGAWCWSRVLPRLEALGHRVVARSLTGLADRAHLAGPEVGLATHVADVTRLLEEDRLDDVVLVGHSYGGMVVSGAAAAVPGRVRHLVYLDAFRPRAGESAFDVLPIVRSLLPTPSAERPWAVPPPDYTTLGVTDPDDAAWLLRESTPMPLRTHEEPATSVAALPETYVQGAALPLFREVAARAEADGAEVVTWPDAAHLLPVTHPDRVAHLLDRVGSTA